MVEDQNKRCQDKIVEANVDFLRSRSNVGVEKYGVTLERGDLTPLQWARHLREELADALNYVTRLEKEIEKLWETAQPTPLTNQSQDLEQQEKSKTSENK